MAPNHLLTTVSDKVNECLIYVLIYRGRSEEGQTGHEQEKTDPDVDTKAVALESAIDKYGECLFGDNCHPTKQFATEFLEFETDPVKGLDESDVTPTSDICSAYNAWAQINLHQVREETDMSPEDVELKPTLRAEIHHE